MPECLPCARVDGFEGLRVIAEKYEAASRGHGASVGVRSANLRVAPGERLSVQTISEENLLRSFTGNPFRASGIKRLSLLELLWLQEKRLALLEREKIDEVGGFVIGRGEPVGCAAVAWTHLGASGRWLQARADGPALSVDAFRPRQFVDKGSGGEKLPVFSIQNVEKSVTVCLHQEFSGLPLIGGVDQDGRFGGIVIVEIMGSELEIPFQLAVIGIEGENAVGVEVVTWPNAAIEIRAGIAGSPE